MFISPSHAPFIQDDLDVLEKHFSVRRQIGHGIGAALKIIVKTFNADITFCWFASVYAFVGVAMARMCGMKSVVIVGGVDAAKDKELDYGIWLTPWKAKLVRYVFHHADRILVVDPCLREEAVRLAEYDGKNISYLPTGYDGEFWKPMGEKEPVVLTVAVARDARALRRKGIDTLIEAARQTPGVTFYIVGIGPEMILHMNPPLNMKFIPPIPRKDILPYYQRAKVYCQPSRREGLPNSLCEAMLCSCIPIASDVSGNPTAVGTEGVLVPPSDPTALASAIRQSLSMDGSLGIRARARIVSMFPRQRRETGLVRTIEELLE